MRITIIHGDDTLASYNKYQELVNTAKSRSFEIINIGSLGGASLASKLRSQSLFEDRVLYVSENPKQFKPKDWDWLSKESKNFGSNFLIHSKGKVDARLISKLPKENLSVQKFDIPFLIFKFLNAFYPGNSRTTLKILNDIKKDQPVEFAFAMLVRSMRDSICRGNSKFKPNQIKEIINQMAEADILSKTSTYDLGNFLDLLIVRQLQ